MTDKEYIKVKALGTITAAINTLRDLVPDNLEEVITKEEYSKVIPTLCDWKERLFKQIETESELGQSEQCTHENEAQYQGDGFVFTVCGDCGEDLD